MRTLAALVVLLAAACGPSQPESCAALEAAAAGDAGPSCAIAPTCAAGGSSYGTQEGAQTCDVQCQAILENGGCS